MKISWKRCFMLNAYFSDVRASQNYMINILHNSNVFGYFASYLIDCCEFLNELIPISNTWPHDHKLRKFLSLKLDFEYLKCYWTHSFNNLQM